MPAWYDTEMLKIESESDLDEMFHRERAFCLVAVNWAIQSWHSELAVSKLVEAWNVTCPTPLYRIDLSEQEGPVWDAVKKWLVGEGQNISPIMMGGYGALLWICSGRITTSVAAASMHSHSELLDMTSAAFKECDV